MVFVAEFRLDFITRIPGAPLVLLLCVPGQRVASLNHESLDDAVECRAVIELLFRELFEVFHGLRRDVRPETDDHFTGGGFDYGDFGQLRRGLFLFILATNSGDTCQGEEQ